MYIYLVLSLFVNFMRINNKQQLLVILTFILALNAYSDYFPDGNSWNSSQPYEEDIDPKKAVSYTHLRAHET